MLDMKKDEYGLVRLGYPLSKLVPWVELWKQARMEPSNKRHLERNGRNKGANPYHWFGSFESIPVGDLVIEEMNDDNQWISSDSLRLFAIG